MAVMNSVIGKNIKPKTIINVSSTSLPHGNHKEFSYRIEWQNNDQIIVLTVNDNFCLTFDPSA